MSPRYGTVARTPVSRRDPELLHALPPRTPPQAAPNPLDHTAADQLLRLGLGLLQDATDRVRFVVRGHWRRVRDKDGNPYRIWINAYIILLTALAPLLAGEKVAVLAR